MHTLSLGLAEDPDCQPLKDLLHGQPGHQSGRFSRTGYISVSSAPKCTFLGGEGGTDLEVKYSVKNSHSFLFPVFLPPTPCPPVRWDEAAEALLLLAG